MRIKNWRHPEQAHLYKRTSGIIAGSLFAVPLMEQEISDITNSCPKPLSKPMLNVALMAAILAFAVSICLKFFATMQAGKGIVSFPFYHVCMRVPPVSATGITTEQFFLAFWTLFNLSTAVFANNIFAGSIMVFCYILTFSSKSAPAAVGFDRFQIQAGCFSNLTVTQSFCSQFSYHPFFTVCHHIRFLSWDCILANDRCSFYHPATISSFFYWALL